MAGHPQPLAARIISAFAKRYQDVTTAAETLGPPLLWDQARILVLPGGKPRMDARAPGNEEQSTRAVQHLARSTLAVPTSGIGLRNSRSSMHVRELYSVALPPLRLPDSPKTIAPWRGVSFRLVWP